MRDIWQTTNVDYGAKVGAWQQIQRSLKVAV